jgi:heme exporter protein A
VSSAPLLRLEGVACRRGGRLLFEGLDLALGPGEAALVTGPNGAGKSSLIRLAAGLLEPAAGRVERGSATALADEWPALDPKLTLGRALACGSATALADEWPALDPKLTLGRALAFWARLDGGDAETGLAAFALTPLRDVPVRMLSTGQRRRAALARVVAGRAPLWLLDEPASGLDSEGQARLGVAMAAHLAGGGSILAATHQPIGLDGAREVKLG